MRRPDPKTVRWGILIALLVLWEVVPLTGLLPELFLPRLSKTLGVLWTDLDKYSAALLVTLYEVALAMVIACGFGIVAGATIGGIARAARSAAARFLQPLCRADRHSLPDLHRLVRHRLAVEDPVRRHLRLFPRHAFDGGGYPHHRSAVPARRTQHGSDRCISRSRASSFQHRCRPCSADCASAVRLPSSASSSPKCSRPRPASAIS